MVNKKALIISIGVGENTEHGIKFSIDTLHPNKVIFVTTSEGKNTLKRIKDDLKKLKISKEILELDSGEKDDIEIVYEKVTSAIIKLKQEGYCSGNIFIDFTFGTKPMSAGIVSAGIAQRVEQLCYVSGSHRDQKTGKVISGYERYKTLKPNKIFSDYMFSHVKRLFNIYAFEEARIILLYIDEVFFDKHEDEKSFYNALIQAYDFWDKFDYTNAFKKFKEAENKKVTWIIDDESYNLNYKFIETLKKKLSSEGKYTKEQIIDIYSNALRRCEEGKFDDALVRMYRVMEFISQYFLFSRYDIDPGRITKNDIGKLPYEFRAKYSAKLEEKNERKVTTSGISENFEILCALGDPFATKYRSEGEINNIQSLLGIRNTSVLTHGLRPISSVDFERIRGLVYGYLRDVFDSDDEFQSLLRSSTMMKLK